MAALRHNLARDIASSMPGLQDDRRVPRLTLKVHRRGEESGPARVLSLRAVGTTGAPDAVEARALAEVERAVHRAGLSPRPDKQRKLIGELIRFSMSKGVK
jgi:hypothetical protein